MRREGGRIQRDEEVKQGERKVRRKGWLRKFLDARLFLFLTLSTCSNVSSLDVLYLLGVVILKT